MLFEIKVEVCKYFSTLVHKSNAFIAKEKRKFSVAKLLHKLQGKSDRLVLLITVFDIL